MLVGFCLNYFLSCSRIHRALLTGSKLHHSFSVAVPLSSTFRKQLILITSFPLATRAAHWYTGPGFATHAHHNGLLNIILTFVCKSASLEPAEQLLKIAESGTLFAPVLDKGALRGATVRDVTTSPFPASQKLVDNSRIVQ